METLKDKRIVLAVCGSIAAYKSAFLARLLIKAGAEVRVIMTRSARDFIQPLSFSTLTHNPVLSDISDGESWNNHVELGLWADLFLVAPATANSIAKMAHGIADNMLVASYLSAKCPVFIAPAMDLDMWKHPSTLENVSLLKKYGNTIIDVEHGELASGLIGEGRMAEPENIISFISNHFSKKKALSHKKVLITAGPTFEDLDPVRFLANRSTGKMGIALAEACADEGAEVHLILGPVELRPKEKNIKITLVRNAAQMYEAAISLFPKMDISILAAAVADYTPANFSNQKIKKKDGELSLELSRTQDIAAALGAVKTKDQVLVGFALETENAMAHAKAKLKKKNLDCIVLNTLEDEGAGFQHDTNKIYLIRNNEEIESYPLQSKKKTAEDIIASIIKRLE
jgi:phosphopantothenoylcysteine decarboxylase/phosphopantothenate--cysteine ligase